MCVCVYYRERRNGRSHTSVNTCFHILVSGYGVCIDYIIIYQQQNDEANLFLIVYQHRYKERDVMYYENDKLNIINSGIFHHHIFVLNEGIVYLFPLFTSSVLF